jgi:transposase InsO family protein
MRRQACADREQRRLAEQSVRGGVVGACRTVQTRGVPVAAVTRFLHLSERTVRRWRRQPPASPPAPRGRRPQWASRAERNEVYRFLHQSGTATSLAAVRAAFPQLRRDDLKDLVRRFRRAERRKAQRRQSRLEWLRPGAVWAADFKERREPLEGRYGWIFSVKDLVSRYQLVWQPVEAANGEVVRATYTRLFAEHGRPLVLKMDNGGPFRDEETKRLLRENQVVPLFSPKRRPSYNGGVERANGQLASYQQAVAEFRGRRAGPTREDAETARQLANELARPGGWCGPTAGQVWAGREPVAAAARSAFLATVAAHRGEVRAEWKFDAGTELTHDQASAIDRHAVRDALVEHGLLRIRPRRRGPTTAGQNSTSPVVTATTSAGILQIAMHAALPTVGGATDSRPHVVAGVQQPYEEAHSSTNKTSASGQN